MPDVVVGRLERRLGRLSSVLFDRLPLWALAAAVLVAAVALYTPFWTPNIDFFTGIAENPFDPPDYGEGNYLYLSPLGPLVAASLGVTTRAGYAVVHGVVVVGAVVAAAFLLRRWHGELVARVFLIAFLASPLSNVLIGWLGQPDPFTFVGSTLVALGPRSGMAVGAVLLGFNHFEQGCFIVVAALALRLRRALPPSTVLLVIGALIAGRFTLSAYHSAAGLDVAGERFDYLRDGTADRYIIAALGNLPTMLFSVYNVLWLGAAAFWRSAPVPLRRTALEMQLLLLVPVLVTLDATRVYAMLTWPIVLIGIVTLVERLPRAEIARGATVIACLALVVPRVVVWEGGVHVSQLPRLLSHLL